MRFMQSALGATICVDDSRCFFTEDAALARELDLLLVTVNERDVELFLEREDVLAKR